MKYSTSIMHQPDGACYICGRTDRALQRHEIFHGANRDRSKQFGLWVNLCYVCHDQLHHVGGGLDHQLKVEGQEAAEIYYGWSNDEFRLIFGRNYL